MEELESPQARERVGRWMEEGHYLLGRVIPTLIEERDRLRIRTEIAEQIGDRLREETGQLQHELAALRTEHQSLRSTHAELAQLLTTLSEQLNQMLKLIGGARERFQTTNLKRP